MFTKILVPLDGSELGERAVPAAQNLASLSTASVHLVQVVSRQPEMEANRGAGYSVQAAELERDLAKRLVEARTTMAGNYLEQVASRIRDAGIGVHTAILEGAAGENIVEYSGEHGIDVVVMSNRGHGGIRRLLLGSTTDHVVRSCEVPAMVLPCQ